MRLAAAGYKIVMHVHDEVVLEVPRNEVDLDAVTGLRGGRSPGPRGSCSGPTGL
jgi:hypothetical protein